MSVDQYSFSLEHAQYMIFYFFLEQKPQYKCDFTVFLVSCKRLFLLEKEKTYFLG